MKWLGVLAPAVPYVTHSPRAIFSRTRRGVRTGVFVGGKTTDQNVTPPQGGGSPRNRYYPTPLVVRTAVRVVRPPNTSVYPSAGAAAAAWVAIWPPAPALFSIT